MKNVGETMEEMAKTERSTAKQVDAEIFGLQRNDRKISIIYSHKSEESIFLFPFFKMWFYFRWN